MSSEEAIRDRLEERDVTVMRSYLEVDVAEWFSDNEVPFGYEPFTIPSVVGPSKDRWDRVVQAIRGVGNGERESVELPSGETLDAFEILRLWNEIYEKHQLAGERVVIDPNPSLAGFGKTMLLPDFVLYPDAGVKIAGEGFDWGEFDYIVEVSGLYGVGLPEEAGRSDWWDWYRVAAVAFKELAYRLLGLWEDVYWVVPDQGQIEGVADGIPPGLREDDHYIIMNTTQAGVQLDALADAVGITAGPVESGLSPAIEPTEYRRPIGGGGAGEIRPVPYEFDGVDVGAVGAVEDAVVLGEGFVVYHGELGEVYVRDGIVQVRESQWRGMNMLLLREYVLDVLSTLGEAGVVTGLEATV